MTETETDTTTKFIGDIIFNNGEKDINVSDLVTVDEVNEALDKCVQTSNIDSLTDIFDSIDPAPDSAASLTLKPDFEFSDEHVMSSKAVKTLVDKSTPNIDLSNCVTTDELQDAVDEQLNSITYTKVVKPVSLNFDYSNESNVNTSLPGAIGSIVHVSLAEPNNHHWMTYEGPLGNVGDTSAIITTHFYMIDPGDEYPWVDEYVQHLFIQDPDDEYRVIYKGSVEHDDYLLAYWEGDETTFVKSKILKTDEDIDKAEAVTKYNFVYDDNRVMSSKAVKTFLDELTTNPNTTITHYAPIEESMNEITDFVIGSPVYLTGKVYKFVNNKFISSTATDTTDCICSVKTNGKWNEYVGICVRIDEKNKCVTFGSGGDYLVRVNDTSCYGIGDEVFVDEGELKVITGQTAITSKIHRTTVRIITAKINDNTLAVFKS